MQRQLPGQEGRITLSVEDIFDSVEMSWITGSPKDPLYVDLNFDGSHRTLKLTYTRRFGSGKVPETRSTASEEERSRVQ